MMKKRGWGWAEVASRGRSPGRKKRSKAEVQQIEQMDPGARVDAWFPGYQWSRGTVLQRNNNGTFCVEWDEQNEKGITTYTPEVAARNIRLAGDPRTRKSEFLPNNTYGCPYTPGRPDITMSPEQQKAKERVDNLQLELDEQEQEIEEIRALLHQLIIEAPGHDECRAEKNAKIKQMFELQR